MLGRSSEKQRLSPEMLASNSHVLKTFLGYLRVLIEDVSTPLRSRGNRGLARKLEKLVNATPLPKDLASEIQIFLLKAQENLNFSAQDLYLPDYLVKAGCQSREKKDTHYVAHFELLERCMSALIRQHLLSSGLPVSTGSYPKGDLLALTNVDFLKDSIRSYLKAEINKGPDSFPDIDVLWSGIELGMVNRQQAVSNTRESLWNRVFGIFKKNPDPNQDADIPEVIAEPPQEPENDAGPHHSTSFPESILQQTSQVFRPSVHNCLMNNYEQINSIFKGRAPKAYMALQSLFRIRQFGGRELTDPILADLTSDSAEGSVFEDFEDIFSYLFEGKKLTASQIQLSAAELELRFCKSMYYNFNLWLFLLKTPQIISSDFLKEVSEVFLQTPFKRSPYIDFLAHPSKNDIYNYLFVFFSLTEEDIPVELIQSFTDDSRFLKVTDIREAVLKNPSYQPLIATGIMNELLKTIPDPELCKKLSEDLAADMAPRLDSFDTRLSAMVNLHQKVRLLRERFLINSRSVREQILRYMDQHYDAIFKEPALYSLSDKDFMARFEAPAMAGCHLSTYFDHAQKGIKDAALFLEATSFSTQIEFSDLKKNAEDIILSYLEPRVCGQAPLYERQNLFFFGDGGTFAFQKFSARYIQEGDHILVTPEEYQGIQDELKTQGAHLDTIPYEYLFGSPERFKATVKQLVLKHGTKYFLVSEVSRRGTVFPLLLFRDLCDELKQQGHKIYFILDGCQAYGRRQARLGEYRPDVYFASIQKGTDLGTAGLLILSNDFVSPDGEGKKIIERGTQEELALARFSIATHPQMIGVQNILTIPERQKALQDLSEKFIRLVDAINAEKESNKIRLYFPKHSYRDASGSFLSGQLTGIFECEVEGMTRFQIAEFARRYGVYIAEYYDDPSRTSEEEASSKKNGEGKRAFRIAFHPHMSNDSLKLLGYVLKNAKPLK